MTMNEKEIILGDYKLVLDYRCYDIYFHNEQVGFKSDMTLSAIGTNDTDLITLLLLKYQPGPEFKMYPHLYVITLHGEIVGECACDDDIVSWVDTYDDT